MSQHYRCCCCKSYTASDFILQTLVPDYADPPGDDIAPYPRCGTVEGDVCPNSCGGGTGEIPCGVWPFALIPRDAGTATYFHEGNQFNASETPAATVSICDEPGFKCAQTIKQWHGIAPLTYCVDGCDTELTTKYRTIDIQITGFVRDNDDFCNSGTVYDERRTWTVNRYSGEITLTNKTCNSWIRTQTSPGVWENITQVFPGFDDFIAFDPCDAGDNPVLYAYYEALTENVTATIDKAADSLEWHILNAITPSPGQCDPLADQEYVTGGGDIITAQLDVVVTLTNGYTPSNVRTDSDAALAYWIFGNNLLFPWRSDTLRSLGVIAKYNELAARSPYLGSEGCDQVDDYRSPTAGSGTVPDPYTAWDQMDWFDPDAYVWVTGTGTAAHETDPAHEIADELVLRYNGAIIGQPFKSGTPTGLPDHMFSWSHITWACWNDGSEHWEARRHGAYAGEDATGIDASDLVIPKSAPLWTENYPAGLLYWGNWIQWNSTDSLQMQKQIELTQEFDAYNRFGPCGRRRHMVDRSKASYVSGYDGTDTFGTGDTLTLIDAIGDGTYPAVIVGGANVGKIFSVAVTGTSCVVGVEDTNARNVALAMEYWTNIPGIDMGLGLVGAVRDWKRSGVSFVPPAICGKVAVTVAVQDGSKVALTLASEQKYLQVGDKVIFVQGDAADTVNNNNSGAGWTLTDAVDDTHFKFTGTLVGTMTGYLKILGAPLAKFNTTARKRQFIWQEWLNDPTTGGFKDDSGVTSPIETDDSYSGERILGSTPNVATDTESKWATTGIPSGDGYDFPATPTATLCGGQSLVVPVQFVTHPLDVNQLPFSAGAAITVCPPKVEAITAQRLTDEGAPALPDGCEFAFPGVPAANGTDCGTGMPNGHSSPWSLCTPSYEA